MLSRRNSSGVYGPASHAGWEHRPVHATSPSHGLATSFLPTGTLAAQPTELIGTMQDLHHIENNLEQAVFRDMPNGRVAELASPTSASTLSPIYDRYWATDRSPDSYMFPDGGSYNQSSSSMFSEARADAYRKKNAKFDIPEGRTLDNLDDLIAHARTEEEAKELKAQKRLLKNREAA